MSECCICSSEDRVLYPVRNPVTGVSRHVCVECVQEIIAIADKHGLIEDADDLSDENDFEDDLDNDERSEEYGDEEDTCPGA